MLQFSLQPRIAYVVNASLLRSACRSVQTDLNSLGFWTKKLADVTVRQTLFGLSYGWQYYHGCGDIVIPRLSAIRLYDNCRGKSIPLRDILSHEYGHAVADCHRGVMRSPKFEQAFGASHDDLESFSYNDQSHVSRYASDSAGEDFAETFMYYIKHKGKLPRIFSTQIIKKKWDFVSYLSTCLKGI